MHILEIPSFFAPHGGLFCLDQAKALKSRGHEVRILSCVQLGLYIDHAFYWQAKCGTWWEEMEGVEIMKHYQRDIPKAVKYNTERWIKTVTRMYDTYVRQYGRPDVIHAHCCKVAGIAATRIGRKENIPVFITEHLHSILFEKDFGLGWTKNRWMKEWIKEAYHEASCVIPVAEEQVENIAPFFGKDYSFQPVSNVIDTDFYTYHPRSQREGRPFHFCCLAIGNIHVKGYDILAKAWGEMTGCHLHIAGNGTDSDEMRQLFAGHHNVTIHGHLDKGKVRDLLHECDALVLPSRSEAQPLVLLEAMSTGIPVVSTETTPHSERIPGACLIAKTGDAASLAEKMKECTHISPSLEISEAVKALASPDVVAEQLESLFLRQTRKEDRL